jgi:5-methyltetrahydropteroyltriglutamate--homocysteine methyltransferase
LPFFAASGGAAEARIGEIPCIFPASREFGTSEALSAFEAANPRHEHEYHIFERVKVPEGKVLCPGVITHASNIVEHPKLIAERLMRFAKLVGRENVMAGADCGFSSQALYKTEVHPTVIWEKFKAMRQGANLATKQLWK